MLNIRSQLATQVGCVGSGRMTYLEWNDALARRFFNEDAAGRPVYLYVTTELIAELGGPESDAVGDFVAAVKQGPPWCSRDGLCQRALEAYREWRTRGFIFPTYIAYLALFVLATGVEGDFAPNAYYPRLRRLLGEADLDGGTLPSFDRMLELWDDLETWSVSDQDGNLGLFEARVVGGWIHVGVPISQTILTDTEREILPIIFAEAGCDPSSPPPHAELATILRSRGQGRLRHRTVSLVSDRVDEDLYKALLDTVADELAEWDGSIPDELVAASGAPSRYGTARLCVRLDKVARRARVTVRARLSGEFPDDGLAVSLPSRPESLQCDTQGTGWSSVLVGANRGEVLDGSTLDWAGGVVFKGTAHTQTWQLSLPGRPVRILIEGAPEGIPGYVETYQLPRSQRVILLATAEAAGKLRPWMDEQRSGVDTDVVDSGLPAGWTLIAIDSVESDALLRDDFPWLRFPDRARLRLRGGVRFQRGDTYFDFAPPYVVAEAADEDDEVRIGRDSVLQSDNGKYRLPDSLKRDSRQVIELVREGIVIAKRSLFLISNFGWHNSEALSVLDQWGMRIAGDRETAPNIAGALVYGGQVDTGRFSRQLLLTPGLDPSVGRVYFIGRIPGQIVNWPSEELPADWCPVWAVQLTRKGKACFCGVDTTAADPVNDSVADSDRIQLWKEVVWRKRRRVVPPQHPFVRTLWQSYLEAARDV